MATTDLKVQIHQKLDKLAEDELEQLLTFVEFLEWKDQGEEEHASIPTNKGTDVIVGMFEGPSDLAANSESLLAQGLMEHSGWTWKEESQ